ncbi:hypothetical protein [Klebsiella quasipneumoniae]|uniref:hypothetical protein n=1 Tax=Klebsiella quasipneumoniae TaxID=1463165 RepID=UPI00388D381C
MLWNTVYLERGRERLAWPRSEAVDDGLLPIPVAALGWEHINPDRRLPLAQQHKIGANEFRARYGAAASSVLKFSFSEERLPASSKRPEIITGLQL